jgi:hypothetical protein
VDIDSAITFKTLGGTLGTLTIIGSGPEQFFWEDETVTGEKGCSLFYRDRKLTATTGHKNEVVTVERFGQDTTPDAHFLDVIRGRTKNQSPPEEFLNVIRFTEAVWESAAKGGVPVKLGEHGETIEKKQRKTGKQQRSPRAQRIKKK